MKKLGLIINGAAFGASVALKCNDGSWSDMVRDLRDYQSYFNLPPQTPSSIILMTFDKGGTCITLLYNIVGRSGYHEFIGGWVYVPTTIQVSGEELMGILNRLKDIFEKKDIGRYKNEIEQLFSTEYPLSEVPRTLKPSSGQLFAVRTANAQTMQALLDIDRYQDYYASYRAVFLIDPAEGISINPNYAQQFRDLTQQPIKQYALLVPPAKERLEPYGMGARIVNGEDKEITAPECVEIGSIQQLYLRRPGCQREKLPPQQVTHRRQEVVLPKTMPIWKRILYSTSFQVQNDRGESIPNATIMVGNQVILPQGICIEESRLQNVHLRVTAPDYIDYTYKGPLLKNLSTITLQRASRAMKAEIKLSNGHMATIHLESTHLPSSGSPLEAYEWDDRRRTLELNSLFLWKQRAYGFLFTIFLLLLVFIGIGVNNLIEDHDNLFGWFPFVENMGNDASGGMEIEYVDEEPEDGEEVEGLTEEQSQQTDPADAIDYLNNNQKWIRAEMENFPTLKGVYDLINEYKFEGLTQREDLNKCPKFKEIIDVSKEAFMYDVSIKGKYETNDTITPSIWIDKVKKRLKDNPKPAGSTIKPTEPKPGAGRSAGGKTPPKPDGGSTAGTDMFYKN